MCGCDWANCVYVAHPFSVAGQIILAKQTKIWLPKKQLLNFTLQTRRKRRRKRGKIRDHDNRENDDGARRLANVSS